MRNTKIRYPYGGAPASTLPRYIPKGVNPGYILVWLDGFGGTPIDRKTKTVYTGTALSQPVDSFTNIHDCNPYKFNGTTSKIDCGSDLLGASALTILSWIYPYGYGEGDNGKVLANGKTFLELRLTNSLFRFFSDGSNFASSANNSLVLNSWNCVCATRNSSGIANIYVNGALSGTADQDSGTPAGGTTNLIIGNINAGTFTFDGYIGLFIAINKVLTASDIGYFYNATK